MRQRLQAFLPIVLIALVVQILAPIGVAWASVSAVSDPLRGVEICHGQPGSAPVDDDSSKLGCSSCALCCLVQQPAALDRPDPSVVDVPEQASHVVVWRAMVPLLRAARAWSLAQARAPPAA
ncbi:hypothetical protein HL667_05980 [Bradyrhizobium sp. 83012]|uniref:DUF2946 domain-containing protein n=1 Tax=Bradyrhizobium aeschynomenes TaxID=2734909 RepID=A0ABX2C9U7_9BRAD|nr:DUF2946 family protein [Bradyrhizobium aeschynomenes]NPU64543.1 hypothetical protein [Bradyrhizobium aeschynomenes]NPV22438.1 hypothetical protein [Bradyrhizobium aeschynomenes]